MREGLEAAAAVGVTHPGYVRPQESDSLTPASAAARGIAALAGNVWTPGWFAVIALPPIFLAATGSSVELSPGIGEPCYRARSGLGARDPLEVRARVELRVVAGLRGCAQTWEHSGPRPRGSPVLPRGDRVKGLRSTDGPRTGADTGDQLRWVAIMLREAADRWLRRPTARCRRRVASSR
jgi:hypothetical protein